MLSQKIHLPKLQFSAEFLDLWRAGKPSSNSETSQTSSDLTIMKSQITDNHIDTSDDGNRGIEVAANDDGPYDGVPKTVSDITSSQANE